VLTFPNLFGRAHPPEKLAGQPHFCWIALSGRVQVALDTHSHTHTATVFPQSRWSSDPGQISNFTWRLFWSPSKKIRVWEITLLKTLLRRVQIDRNASLVDWKSPLNTSASRSIWIRPTAFYEHSVHVAIWQQHQWSTDHGWGSLWYVV
jgi:hypothetical protein